MHSYASCTAVVGLLLGAILSPATWAQTPVVSLGNASVIEGNAGITTLDVPLTRTGDSQVNIGVAYRSDIGGAPQATAGSDYQDFAARFGVLPAGSNKLNLPVNILGDSAAEPDEQFLIHLLSAHNAGPTPDFAGQRLFASGNLPQSLAHADVNSDGRLDLMVANRGANTVSVLLNTSAPGATTPSFAAQQSFATDTSPQSVASADVNGDGRPDLMVANFISNTVSVLLNTTASGATTPSFAAQQSFATGVSPSSIAAADLNGDGRPDLVLANQGTSAGTVSVLLNATVPGAAAPSFAAQQSFATGAEPRSVAVADLNRDGRPDLMVASFSSNSVSVLINHTAAGAATPSFAAQQSFATGSNPASVAASDLNGDGRPDLILANFDSDTVSVLLNTAAPGAAAPSFAAQQRFATGSNPVSVTAADLNGDGRPDLMVANQNANTLSVLLNTAPPGAATPSFAAQQNFATGAAARAVVAADLNGDGRPDLMVANQNASNVSVLFNATVSGATTASFAAQQSFAAGSNPGPVVAADLNGDGRPDLMVASLDSVAVLLNTTAPGATTPSFAAPQSVATDSTPGAITAADLDGDGRLDLVVSQDAACFPCDGSVSVLLNTTAAGAVTASFATRQTFATGVLPRSVAAADLNGDGRPELIVANSFSNTVSVLLNLTAPGAATPSFTEQQTLESGFNPVAVTSADINGDGRPDLLVAIDGSCFKCSGVISVLLNTTAPGAATTSFTTSYTFFPGMFETRHPVSVAAADLNGDGRPDLMVVDSSSSVVYLLLNTTEPGASTASFAAQQRVATGSGPTASDLNGDGRPDLIITDSNANAVSVLLNTTAPGAATPSFAAQQSFAAGSNPGSAAAADLNGDGRPDLMVANADTNSVSVLLNRLYPATLNVNEAVATIIDDDGSLTLSFTVAAQSVGEAIARAVVTVQLSAASDLPVTVPLNFSGSAAFPADYERSSSSLTIPAGMTRASLSLRPVDDSAFEASETVIVSLGAVSNARVASPASHTLTLVDNDAKALSSLSLAPATASPLTLSQHCVIATAKDSVGTALPDLALMFRVTGANPGTATVSTGSAGTAQHCYTASEGGHDKITVRYTGSLGLKTATTSVSFNKRNTALAVETVTAIPVSQGPRTLIVLNPKAVLRDSSAGNAPVAGRLVSFKTGSRHLCKATSNAQGVATCEARVASEQADKLSRGYTGLYAGDDAYSGSQGSGAVLGLE